MIRTRTEISSLIIICLVIIYSCHPSFCIWDSGYEQLKELPSKESIIGLYELTSNSKKFIQSKGFNTKCQLFIEDSSKFNIKEIPDFVIDSNSRLVGKLIDKSGKWFSSCDDSYGCMIELEGLQVMPLAKGKNGKISILMTIGDGDECKGIIFEQIKK